MGYQTPAASSSALDRQRPSILSTVGSAGAPQITPAIFPAMICPPAGLENEPQPELDFSRIKLRTGSYAKAWAAQRPGGTRERVLIQNVEKLRPELESQALVKRGVLSQGKVPIAVSCTAKCIAAQVARMCHHRAPIEDRQRHRKKLSNEILVVAHGLVKRRAVR